MATIVHKTQCSICTTNTNTSICRGCSEAFCFDHLTEHRQLLNQQFHHIENDYNVFRQTLIDQRNHPEKRLLIQEIEQWKNQSIEKVNQIAETYKRQLITYTNKSLDQIENKLNNTIQATKLVNEINELNLEQLTKTLHKLKEEIDKPANVIIKQESSSIINKISVIIPVQHFTSKQHRMTVAGGNNQGIQLNQLSQPDGLAVDDVDQTIYIADSLNRRIIEWTSNAKSGQVVAGGQGQGNQLNQLSLPTDVIIDKENNALIISDYGNRRLMQWSRQNNTKHGQILLADIDCYGLAMNKNGNIYISDCKNNQVRRWKRGETNGTIVAGGNGKGTQLNQLNFPTYIFIDDDETLYISDCYNHRVMKWIKDAKQGIIVAGGNNHGNSLSQLHYPQGIFVDQLGQIYIADYGNHRVMLWPADSKQGTIFIDGNAKGKESDELNGPKGLTFDQQGNLYIVDSGNHRIEKFQIE